MYVEGVLLFASALTNYVAAAPLNSAEAGTSTIVRRAVTWDKSCERTNPYAYGGKKYKDKAQIAFADAQEIAKYALNVPRASDGSLFSGSQAYKNYFSPDTDEESAIPKMMQAIYDNRLDENVGGYSFEVKCGSDQDKESCKDAAFAATNFFQDTPRIILCDQFFRTNVNTKYNLADGTFPEDPTNPPPRLGRNSWCQGDKTFDFFEVAGLTVFHEMTHLDVVGQRAGLPVVDDNSHGTIDIYEIGEDEDKKHYDPNSPWGSGRTLRKLLDAYQLDNTQYKPLRSATRNAESYAAAALEWYFMVRCEFDQILPFTSYGQ